MKYQFVASNFMILRDFKKKKKDGLWEIKYNATKDTLISYTCPPFSIKITSCSYYKEWILYSQRRDRWTKCIHGNHCCSQYWCCRYLSRASYLRDVFSSPSPAAITGKMCLTLESFLLQIKQIHLQLNLYLIDKNSETKQNKAKTKENKTVYSIKMWVSEHQKKTSKYSEMLKSN